MSSRPPEPQSPADAPPPLGAVLRHYGPWLALVLVTSIGAIGYLDLRDRVRALEGASHAAVATADELAAVAPEDAGAARAPLVEQGEPPQWECAGTIAEEMVRLTVGRDGPEVLRCVAARPGLEGTLRLSLRVGRDGHVDGAHVSGADDAALVRCAGESALSWRFPPPAGGECAIVEVPFALGPISAQP